MTPKTPENNLLRAVGMLEACCVLLPGSWTWSSAVSIMSVMEPWPKLWEHCWPTQTSPSKSNHSSPRLSHCHSAHKEEIFACQCHCWKHPWFAPKQWHEELSVREQVSFARPPALSLCCSSGVEEVAHHARGSLVTVLLVWRGGSSTFASLSLPDSSFSSQMVFGLSRTNTERHADSCIMFEGGGGGLHAVMETLWYSAVW